MRQQDHRSKRRPFPEAEARRVMRRLLEGVAAMRAASCTGTSSLTTVVVASKICHFELSCAADNSGASYMLGLAMLRGLRRGRRHVGA